MKLNERYKSYFAEAKMFYIVRENMKTGKYYILGKPNDPLTEKEARTILRKTTEQKDTRTFIFPYSAVMKNPDKYIISKDSDGDIITMANYNDYEW